MNALEQIISSNGGKVLNRSPPRLITTLVDKEKTTSIADMPGVSGTYSTMVTYPYKFVSTGR